MQPLAVDLQLLRSVETADLRIAAGRILSARVIDLLPGGRGTLSVAGQAIEAQLPAQLKPGQELRLQVRDVTDGRVLLGIVGHAEAQVPPPIVPLPDGGALMTQPKPDDDRAGGSGSDSPGAHTVSLRYDAPALGPIDLTFRLDPAGLGVTVTLPPGRGLDALIADADALRNALTARSDGAVMVSVLPRHDPLDLYA